MPATIVRRLGFADIDFQVKQFVGALHRLGRFDQADAQVDFHEIVNGDFGFQRRDIRRRGRRSLRFRADWSIRWAPLSGDLLAEQSSLSPGLVTSSSCIFSIACLASMRGNSADYRLHLLARAQAIALPSR